MDFVIAGILIGAIFVGAGEYVRFFWSRHEPRISRPRPERGDEDRLHLAWIRFCQATGSLAMTCGLLILLVTIVAVVFDVSDGSGATAVGVVTVLSLAGVAASAHLIANQYRRGGFDPRLHSESPAAFVATQRKPVAVAQSSAQRTGIFDIDNKLDKPAESLTEAIIEPPIGPSMSELAPAESTAPIQGPLLLEPDPLFDGDPVETGAADAPVNPSIGGSASEWLDESDEKAIETKDAVAIGSTEESAVVVKRDEPDGSEWQRYRPALGADPEPARERKARDRGTQPPANLTETAAINGQHADNAQQKPQRPARFVLRGNERRDTKRDEEETAPDNGSIDHYPARSPEYVEPVVTAESETPLIAPDEELPAWNTPKRDRSEDSTSLQRAPAPKKHSNARAGFQSSIFADLEQPASDAGGERRFASKLLNELTSDSSAPGEPVADVLLDEFSLPVSDEPDPPASGSNR